MKHLKLQNEHYKVLVKSYKQWLDILGYAGSTVYNLPNHLQEFFYYLEQNSIRNINQITTKIVKEYYNSLKERANERQSGALSKSYLNKHQQALKKFKEYLQNHNHKGINIHLKSEKQPTEEKLNVLTIAEVKELFEATEFSHTESRFRLRDKAILTVLYSCGLRRNEAVHLDIGDILFDKERVFVRKGKNYKERYVPINRRNAEILEDYIYEARPEFYQAKESEALFINHHGTRMQGMSFANRLKVIVETTENKNIIDKQITLHILRHSIATHLLQKEVPLESIKTFLGHSSLESTQIYTHLFKTLENEAI
ncbi:tyrosine-type recombinase/integrase [Zunongwangia pacifica]|uniref:Tyrosine-type recombinase/integrase n=1 Tax=Zunongwangia pacifica TaxID=2911062 RepID=A0A9X1ZX78_9FLAO|nr:tyrosine-type recombinase/integrase [Zunongwangia pacifica]MCL6220825.1 tyrosine-type recombinase/integrase [Zunongwangia pacifica]